MQLISLSSLPVVTNDRKSHEQVNVAKTLLSPLSCFLPIALQVEIPAKRGKKVGTKWLIITPIRGKIDILCISYQSRAAVVTPIAQLKVFHFLRAGLPVKLASVLFEEVSSVLSTNRRM